MIKAVLATAMLISGLLAPQDASASHLLGMEPPESLIVTRGDYQWVWAAPCAGQEPSCGVVSLHHDFSFATDENWLASFSSLSDLMTAFTDPGGNAICAAPYFSTNFDYCDYEDAQFGYVWHSPFAPTGYEREHFLGETFLVRQRTASGPIDVSEPAALAVAGLGLLGAAAARRRKW